MTKNQRGLLAMLIMVASVTTHTEIWWLAVLAMAVWALPFWFCED